MFGYITTNQPELKIREYVRYRGFYCGLCRSLYHNFGISSRLSLTYDMTFLVMLLTSLYEPETQEKQTRCPLHPVKKHLELSNCFSDYGADMNMLCTWYLTKDKILDAADIKDKVTGNSLSVLYRKSFKKLKIKYPEKIKSIEALLKKLHKLETEGSTDLDQLSTLSGHITEEFFSYKSDEWNSSLRAIGFYLGKFIYIMDAWEDVEKDKKSGSFNPLIKLYSENEVSKENFDTICRSHMNMVMSECASLFERLPLIEDAEILRNIIYMGVWTRYELVRNKRSSEKERK